MKTYENKDELKKEIKKTYEKYIEGFLDIPENLKDKKNKNSRRKMILN